ncbi:MAG: hypothetical protein H0U79_06170 [Solirubrobacterales bacterium]|nr:hypothetical protein [Solirubrobacterales bacterium]
MGQQTESERQQAWTRTLMDLPVQQAVLVTADNGDNGDKEQAPCVIRVVNVASLDVLGQAAGVSLERYLSAAAVAGGQSLREIEAAHRWREEQVELLAASGTAAAATVEPRSSFAGANEKAAQTPRRATINARTTANADMPARSSQQERPQQERRSAGSRSAAPPKPASERLTPTAVVPVAPASPSPLLLAGKVKKVHEVDDDGSLG